MQKLFKSRRNSLVYLLSSLFLLACVETNAQRIGWNRVSYHVKSGLFLDENSIKIKKNGNSFNIKYEGDFSISDDDKDVVKISEGGFLEITKSSFGSKRKIVIESSEEDRLKKRYYVGFKEKDYVPEGKKWLAEILPELLKTTTLASKSRVERFYKKGGIGAVMTEIQQLGSDYVRSAYFGELIKKGLDDKQLAIVIKGSGEMLKSDHYLSELLTRYQGAFIETKEALSAYIDVSGNLSSDYYKAKVMKMIVKNQAISDQQMTDLLEITKEIQSDHYKSEVLKNVIKRKDLSPEAYKALIGTMNDIQSDHYLGEVVKELWAEKLAMNENELNDLLILVNGHLQSDFYMTNFYKSLSRRKLSEEQLKMTFTSLKNIQSDYYLSETLQSFAPQVRNSSEDVKSAYRSAMKSIQSSTYYGRAAKAID